MPSWFDWGHSGEDVPTLDVFALNTETENKLEFDGRTEKFVTFLIFDP